jgi:DNA (cytosine-5)-methyltransferase 1
MALRNIGVDYEVVGISEKDKYAIKAYEATHSKVNNLGDISKIKVEDVPEHDLFTYSFCCQDVSVAGKQKGIKRGETRSGLLYECERIIEHCKPKYLLMENVKNLVGKKFRPQFDEWLKYLENLGYTNYWQVLNAKDYGVPQNRERVFVVSILGDHKPYNFPKGFKLEKNIKSILEEDVNVKYYLSDETVKKLTLKKDFIVSSKDNTTTEHIVKVGNIYPSGGQNGNIYNPIGISPAISAGTGVNGNGIGSNNAPKIILTNNTNGDKRVIELPCIGASRGRNPENPTSRVSGLPTEQRLEINTKGVSNTLTTVQKDNYVLESNLKIRKLTPRECFRLMGVSEEDIDKIQAAGISETQQYKMAGNSIVVPVLEGIFRELFL